MAKLLATYCSLLATYYKKATWGIVAQIALKMAEDTYCLLDLTGYLLLTTNYLSLMTYYLLLTTYTILTYSIRYHLFTSYLLTHFVLTLVGDAKALKMAERAKAIERVVLVAVFAMCYMLLANVLTL